MSDAGTDRQPQPLQEFLSRLLGRMSDVRCALPEYLLLLSRADAAGNVALSMSAIAQVLRKSKDGVRLNLRQLGAAGVLTITRADGKITRYQVRHP
jgi:hypothetical protein